MKKRKSRNVIPKAAFLFLLALAVIPSCSLFHFDKLHPVDDYTSDHLRDYRISKLSIVVSDSVKLYPGASFPIDVIAVTAGKRELKTRGLPKGFVNWNSYAVRVEGGTFDKGIVTVNNDPRNTGKPFKIFVYPYYYPEVKGELSLQMGYKSNFIADCKGQKGMNGTNGLRGGAVDSLKSPYVPKGRRGETGSDGSTGNDGCLADVFVKAMTVGDQQLMNVLVINHCDNSRSVFWIDPDGGSLLVDVSGGEGGDGGAGGDGEAGKDGAGAQFNVQPTYDYYPQTTDDPRFYHNGYYYFVDLAVDSTKNPSGNGSPGGIGANGGRAGDGGNGGAAIIHLDSSAVRWKNKIMINSSAGQAGKPGQGGYAGAGGRAAYGMQTKVDGRNGYIGATGIKGKSGQEGTAPIYRVEKIKVTW